MGEKTQEHKDRGRMGEEDVKPEAERENSFGGSLRPSLGSAADGKQEEMINEIAEV